jgi:hypothetical protein
MASCNELVALSANEAPGQVAPGAPSTLLNVDPQACVLPTRKLIPVLIG